MINNYERNKELIESGMVDAIKSKFNNNQHIPYKYFVLMADYVDSLSQVSDSLFQDPIQIGNRLPSAVSIISEINTNGVYGRTDGTKITMNSNLDDNNLKLYFFHELTHALQTDKINGNEVCGFYNGKNGMFLTEGATQYIAELLYCSSNKISKPSTLHQNSIRGLNNHNVESSLSEYQFNGNVLVMIAKVTALPINQVIALSYRKDGRQYLQEMYDEVCGIGTFDNLMNDLEKIYMIDKIIISGGYTQLNVNTPVNIISSDGKNSFKGNINTHNDLINKVQRELMYNFIANNETEYVLSNYQSFEKQLTTSELKKQFLNAIQELSIEYNNNREEIPIQGIRKNGFVDIVIILTTISIIAIGIVLAINIIK